MRSKQIYIYKESNEKKHIHTKQSTTYSQMATVFNKALTPHHSWHNHQMKSFKSLIRGLTLSHQSKERETIKTLIDDEVSYPLHSGIVHELNYI